jgi:hypothetical protein
MDGAHALRRTFATDCVRPVFSSTHVFDGLGGGMHPSLMLVPCSVSHASATATGAKDS